MRILVTGGAGKIGSRTVELLRRSGHETICLDVVAPKSNDQRFIVGDLRDRKVVEQATKDVDAVLHFAAYPTEPSIPSYPEGWDLNSTGSFNVFEHSVRNGVKKVIFASSICATGLITWVSSKHGVEYFPIDESHPCRPQNLYGTCKLMAEELARMYSARSETSFMCLRFATVWFDSPDGGPDEGTKGLIDEYVKDPEAILRRPPKQGRSIAALKDLAWQYVGVWDVAQACRLALDNKGIKFGVYNIGASDTCSSLDSLKIVNLFYPGVRVKDELLFEKNKKAALWDISAASRELGYSPRFNWKEYA